MCILLLRYAAVRLVLSLHGLWLQDALYSEHVEVPVKCIQGVLYVRLSVHIYNTIEDYAKLADVIAMIEKNVGQ